jgi:protein-L-isoaspartate(D-aspartate) O-methyltransferase
MQQMCNFVAKYITLHLTDTYRHKGLRRRLLESLRDKGITNQRILAAMDVMPRHFFLEKAFEEWAYQDKAFPIGCEQTISQPYTVAYQTELLNVQKKDKILEIGTGSGYQAAILACMGARVYSVERQETLYLGAKNLLQELGLDNLITLFFQDGYAGLPEHAPFDKILVTAAAPEIPEILRNQLVIGGIMVIPVNHPSKPKSQQMLKLTRDSENTFSQMILDDFRFVPFLKGIIKHT